MIKFDNAFEIVMSSALPLTSAYLHSTNRLWMGSPAVEPTLRMS
jgi:hypothetical protein